MSKCGLCNDTGIIETGNNDLPCSCPAGMTAKFNVAGVDGPVTGEDLRIKMFVQPPPRIIGKTGATREEFGHVWEWHDANANMRGHWKSTKGNTVRVFPPSEGIRSWIVNVCNEEDLEISGGDAEERAFCSAEIFTRQKR